tara:strand:- start:28072 stop:28266 length:195 start_codon:yes stop_codon:yes gene_type:complete
MNMEMWQEVAIESIRKEILSLVTDQKSALIKAGPGKDKNVHEIVDNLHRQISIRIDTIKHIESL